MELYEVNTTIEKLLRIKADHTYTPLGGSIELLPLCNMDCKMCYVRQTKAEMDAQGRMLTCDEWLRIAKEASEQGVLFLLLTGGEPLLYPDFRRLFHGLSQMGLILTVNTNGTLIDEEWADFFATCGVRRINITLYGSDDATYGALCSNPKGFSQVMRAAKLLKARNVPLRFTCSLTPDNMKQLSAMREIAQSFDVPFVAASYMFPASRRELTADQQYRLTPEQAAKTVLESFQYAYPMIRLADSARGTLAKMNEPPKWKDLVGFPCHAGRSGFWMTWKGELMPCGMFHDMSISMVDRPFKECWDYVVQKSAEIHLCQECLSCDKLNLCHVCPASCYAETGKTDGRPEYMCQMIDSLVQEMELLVSDDSDFSQGK